MSLFNTFFDIISIPLATVIALTSVVSIKKTFDNIEKAKAIINREENEREWSEAREQIEEFLTNMEEDGENDYVKERLLVVLQSMKKM